MEMNLEEWEFLPDNKSFLDCSHECANDPVLPNEVWLFDKVIQMDYFICPSPSKDTSSPSSKTCKELIVASDAITSKKPDDDTAKDFKSIGTDPPLILDSPDPLPCLLFKKIKEDELVNMKLNFPRLPSTREFIMPTAIETRAEELDQRSPVIQNSKVIIREEEDKPKDCMEVKVKNKGPLDNFSVCMWRWKFTGIGALCSVGVAAATTLCILISAAACQKHNPKKIQFQLCADDKRITQMVQQTTRLNQAFLAARGASVTNAHISFGGYYEGLC